MHKHLIFKIVWSSLFLFLSSHSVYANDSAAGLAATGIYLKQEKNISIEKEVLYINEDKIEVSYIFKNHSDKDIVTEVAFPMPDYEFDESGNTWYPLYDDFTVEINGAQIKHQEEIRAFVNNKDYTKTLNDMGISIRDFAAFDHFFFHEARKENRPKYFFEKLTQDQQQVLLANEIVSLQGSPGGKIALPMWRVSRKYYWTQVFPAKSTTSVKHSYKPYKGFDYVGEGALKPINDACINNDIKRKTKDLQYAPHFTYVDYILTTANNWKQPIKSFHLIIDGHGPKYNKDATMCFEKKLKKIGVSRYEVMVPNFQPKNDITVYFFD